MSTTNKKTATSTAEAVIRLYSIMKSDAISLPEMLKMVEAEIEGYAGQFKTKWIPVKTAKPKHQNWVKVKTDDRFNIYPHYYFKGKWYAMGSGQAVDWNVTDWAEFEKDSVI